MGDLGTEDEHHTRQTLARVRHEEARTGAALLGVREVVTLEHHDGELLPDLQLRAQIASYYRKWQPDTLFTFDPSWLGQIHPDHRACGQAAIDAILPSRMRLYHPEQLAGARVAHIRQAFLFSPANPSVSVDVTDVYDRKVQAALAHKSQFPNGDRDLDWMRALDSEAAKRASLPGRYMEHFGVLRLW
jgi:LmbE family N-acetylglucosaminyl deacetylase